MSESCRLSLKVIPNAPRTSIAGWIGDELKVKIHAPPLEGRANEELCAFFAKALQLPKRAVTVVQGDKSRHKVIEISGLALATVKQRLALDRDPA